MIAPMRMVTVVCHQPDAAAALLALRELGVLHLLPARVRPSADFETTQKQHERALAALALLPRGQATVTSPRSHVDATDADAAAAEAVATELELLGATRQRIEHAAAELRVERDVLLPFGDFDPAQARALAEHGVELKLYLLPRKGPFPDAPADSAVQVVGHTDQATAAVLVGPKGAALAGRELPMPARSLAAITAELADQERRAAEVEARLQTLAPQRGALQLHAARLAETVELLGARAGMGEEPDLCWLEGACPATLVPGLEAGAAAHGWALSVREPGPDDRVPTLLESPQWVRQVHAVLKMLGITPGYGEPDSGPALPGVPRAVRGDADR